MIREIVTELERKLSLFLARIIYPAPGANTLVREEEKILVLDTGENYRFPGGLVEAGETPEEAAKREFKEETDLEAQINKLEHTESKFDGITAVHMFFSGELNEDFSKYETWEGETKLVEKNELPEKMKRIVEKTGV